MKLIGFKEAVTVNISSISANTSGGGMTPTSPGLRRSSTSSVSTLKKEKLPMKEPIGKLVYQPPEMLNGAYTEKCDIWSIGVAVYYALCGDLPLCGKNDETVKSTIMNGHLYFRCIIYLLSHPYIEQLWSSRSSQCKDFIKLMLSGDPDERPSC